MWDSDIHVLSFHRKILYWFCSEGTFTVSRCPYSAYGAKSNPNPFFDGKNMRGGGGGILRYIIGNMHGTQCLYCLFQCSKLKIHYQTKRDWESLMTKPGFDECGPPARGFLLLCNILRLYLSNWTRLGNCRFDVQIFYHRRINGDLLYGFNHCNYQGQLLKIQEERLPR